MFEKIFKGIFDTDMVSVISVPDFLICMAVALGIGIFFAAVYTYKSRYTKSFLLTLAILPAVVSVVIMMVNGNVGAGVAVAGAFSLVRFRSVPGTAKEIAAIFLAMGTGLVVGMGYLSYAVLFALIMGLVTMLYQRLGLGKKKPSNERIMRVTIPEDLNYTDVFEDLFEKYTSEHELTMVKTTNMGSMFKLTYNIVLKDPKEEKALIDEIRCRNGNLEISVSDQEVNIYEL